MPFQQMRCRDLQSGDVLLKVNSQSLSNRLIALGQNVSNALAPSLERGQNAEIVHAGIMFDNIFIVEASGGGLHGNDLRMHDKPFGYYVYRCRQPNVARGAGTCSKMLLDIQHRHGNLNYGYFGALTSIFGRAGDAKTRDQMDQLLDRILDGKGSRFFCSQFVVYVYQFTAEQCGMAASSYFDVSDAKATPSLLASRLQGHPKFEEVGYMIANER